MAGLIAYANYADDATITAGDIGAGSVTRSLDNLKTRQLANVASIDGSLKFEVDVDLGSALPIRCVAMLGIVKTGFLTNLQGQVTVNGSVKISSEPTHATPLFTGSLYTVANEKDGMPLSVFCVVDAGIVGRYVRVRINEPLPGFQERSVGRLWISQAVVLSRGVDSQWTLDLVDPGSVEASAGGQWYESRRPLARRLSFSLTGAETDTTFGFDESEEIDPQVESLQIAAFALGSTGEAIVLPRTATSPWLNRLGVYGHLERPLQIRHLAGPKYAINGAIIEER